MTAFANGALFALCLVAALFFWRFWRDTHERLFVYFALAFITLGVQWAIVGLELAPLRPRHEFYLFRLVAFVLIIIGIIDKNRRGRGRG